MRIASLLPVALVVLPFAGCHNPSEPVSDIAVPLSLRVVASRASVISGDTVTVRLTARNLGTRAVTLDTPHRCWLGLRVLNPRGEPREALTSTPGTCPAQGTRLAIAPGDSLVEVRTWTAGVLVGGDVLSYAEPGQWTLHAGVFTPSGLLSGTLDMPATVTVLPR
jgi:hypothetical protein